TFAVTDPGAAGTGGGAGGVVCRDGVAAMPKGFPPIAIYTLVDSELRGNVLVAPGPQNIYYKRTVVPTDKQVGTGSCWSQLDRMDYRIRLMAELSDTPVIQARNLFRRNTSISYRGMKEFAQEVAQDLSRQEQGIREILRTIKDHGLVFPPDTVLRITPTV